MITAAYVYDDWEIVKNCMLFDNRIIVTQRLDST